MEDDSTVETHANERTDTETEAMTDFLEFAGRRARVGCLLDEGRESAAACC